MNFFGQFYTAAIASIAFLAMGSAQVSSTPEQLIQGTFNLEADSGQNNIGFTPPEFDYAPISRSAPLVKSEIWQTIGQNAVVVGDYFNALVAFDKAVQLAPDADPEILEQRGWLNYSLGYEEEALQDFSKAAELYLNNSNFSAYSNTLYMREFVDVQLDS